MTFDEINKNNDTIIDLKIENSKGILENIMADLQAIGESVIVNPDCIYVGYDGGNHPEYESNMFSMVEKISLIGESSQYDSGVYISTEDGEIELSRLTYNETFELYKFVHYRKQEYESLTAIIDRFDFSKETKSYIIQSVWDSTMYLNYDDYIDFGGILQDCEFIGVPEECTEELSAALGLWGDGLYFPY